MHDNLQGLNNHQGITNRHNFYAHFAMHQQDMQMKVLSKASSAVEWATILSLDQLLQEVFRERSIPRHLKALDMLDLQLGFYHHWHNKSKSTEQSNHTALHNMLSSHSAIKLQNLPAQKHLDGLRSQKSWRNLGTD